MLTLLWRSTSRAQENKKEVQSTSHHTQQVTRERDAFFNFSQFRPFFCTTTFLISTARGTHQSLQPKGDQATYGCIEIIREVGQGKRERMRPFPQPGSWACFRKLIWKSMHFRKGCLHLTAKLRGLNCNRHKRSLCRLVSPFFYLFKDWFEFPAGWTNLLTSGDFMLYITFRISQRARCISISMPSFMELFCSRLWYLTRDWACSAPTPSRGCARMPLRCSSITSLRLSEVRDSQHLWRTCVYGDPPSQTSNEQLKLQTAKMLLESLSWQAGSKTHNMKISKAKSCEYMKILQASWSIAWFS